MAGTAGLDAKLKANVQKALKAESARPLFFALVMKGSTGGKLIVNRAKIPSKQIEAARKETGGSAVLIGVCFGDHGTLVFETAKPAAATAVSLTRTLLKKTANLTLNVEYRLGRDVETMPDSEEPDQGVEEAADAAKAAEGKEGSLIAGVATRDDQAAEWERRVTVLEPKVLQAQKTRKGEAKWLTLFTTAQELGSAGDFASSVAILDKLEGLLNAPPGGEAIAGATPVSQTIATEIGKPEVVAQLVVRTARAATATVPTAAPQQALTNDFLKTIASKNPPERLQEVAGHVGELAPQFLMAITSELTQTSGGLGAGDALSAQDQMLIGADIYNAAARSMKKWADFLSQAEAAGKRLDQLEAASQQGGGEANPEAQQVLKEYHAARIRGLAEQARVMKHVQALLAEYKGVQTAGSSPAG